VESGFFLDVVVSERAPVLELLAGKDQTLLVGGNACFVVVGGGGGSVVGGSAR